MPSYCCQMEMQLARSSKHSLRRFILSLSTAPSPAATVGILFTGYPSSRTLSLCFRSIRCFASQLTVQTRSKYGPTLRAGFVVLPVITSRPLRLPYVHTIYLAGFTRLDTCLPQLEFCRDAGISGPTSAIFHRMPLAIPRVPVRCFCPLLP